jgi:hypothetical protein
MTHSPQMSLDIARSIQDDHLRRAEAHRLAALATAPRGRGRARTPLRRRPLRVWRRLRPVALA